MSSTESVLKEGGEHTISDLTILKRIWNYWGTYRWVAGLAFLCLFMAKAIKAYIPLGLGLLIQSVLSNANADLAIRNQEYSKLVWECLFLGFLLFLSFLLEGAHITLTGWWGQQPVLKMRCEVYNHIQRLPLKFFDQTPIGSLMSYTVQDLEQINKLVGESFVPIFGSLLLYFCIFIAMLWINWQLFLVVLVLTPILGWLTYNFLSKQKQINKRLREIISNLNVFLQENLVGAFTIRNLGLVNNERKIYKNIVDQLKNVNLENQSESYFYLAGINYYQNLIMIIVFMCMIIFFPANLGAMFFVFMLYINMLMKPIWELVDRYKHLQSAIAAGRRIFNLLDNQATEPQHPSVHPLTDIETIEFDHVWFAYEQDNWILKDLTFSIKKGETIAIVGPTGTGKTSIISLLLRFYDFQKGTIRINGRNIKDYALSDLRRQFSLVLQDPVIFSGSIEENVNLYDSTIGKEQIEKVIEHLQMGPFLERFPDRLSHFVSERGQNISVGEMQIISLIRAMAHRRSILMLDEATSNIDSVQEKIIKEALKKILHEQTSIVIAHRLSTIQDATRIIVVLEGKVAESGTHEDLLRANGIYASFYHEISAAGDSFTE